MIQEEVDSLAPTESPQAMIYANCLMHFMDHFLLGHN